MVSEHGAVVISKSWSRVPVMDGDGEPGPDRAEFFNTLSDDTALICVVDNGPFEAAGYAYSLREFEAFSRADDDRVRTWLTMDKKMVQKLSGFDPDDEFLKRQL